MRDRSILPDWLVVPLAAIVLIVWTLLDVPIWLWQRLRRKDG